MDTDNLRYRDAPQRRATILEHLRAKGYATTAELAEVLGVSEMTVRRDARLLHKAGKAISVRGALRLPDQGERPRDSAYATREATATRAKATIGRLSVADIRPDDVIAIDAGTTAFQVAAALPGDFRGTVITHSIPVIAGLVDRPQIKAIALGGDIYQPSRALVGTATVDHARRLRVRTFFLGAAAVDERGIYASGDVERQVKQTLMDIADRVVLVIDRSKFDATAPVFLCPWGAVDAVVSDQPLPQSIVGLVRAGDVQTRIGATA